MAVATSAQDVILSVVVIMIRCRPIFPNPWEAARIAVLENKYAIFQDNLLLLDGIYKTILASRALSQSFIQGALVAITAGQHLPC